MHQESERVVNNYLKGLELSDNSSVCILTSGDANSIYLSVSSLQIKEWLKITIFISQLVCHNYKQQHNADIAEISVMLPKDLCQLNICLPPCFLQVKCCVFENNCKKTLFYYCCVPNLSIVIWWIFDHLFHFYTVFSWIVNF